MKKLHIALLLSILLIPTYANAQAVGGGGNFGGTCTIAGSGALNVDTACPNGALVYDSTTTTITGIGSSSSPVGSYIFLKVSGATAITYNATTLILPASATQTIPASSQPILCDVPTTVGDWECGVTTGSPHYSINNNVLHADSGIGSSSSISFAASYHLLYSATAPTTFSAAWGSTTALTTNNGSAAFTFTIAGSGEATTALNFVLAAASNSWICKLNDQTSNAVNPIHQVVSGTPTTTPTFASASAPVAGDVIDGTCIAN